MTSNSYIYYLVYPLELLDAVVFCVEQKTSRPSWRTCSQIGCFFARSCCCCKFCPPFTSTTFTIQVLSHTKYYFKFLSVYYLGKSLCLLFMIELIQFTFRCRCDKLMRDRDLIRRWSRRNDSFTFCTNNYPEVSMSVYKERKAPPDRPLAINYSTMLKKEDEGN